MIVVDFPSNWYIFTLINLGILVLFYSLRMDRKKKSIRESLAFGFLAVFLCVFVEFLGVNLGLWNYTGGNWPVILWFNYFISAMMGYQLIKIVEYRIKSR